MKIKLIFSILFVIVSSLIITPIMYNGLYWYGIIWCKKDTPNTCEHEVAHYLDSEADRPSSSKEFIDTVYGLGLDLMLEKKGTRETYARLFAFANGKKENMPEDLKEFYDWDLSEELLKGFR